MTWITALETFTVHHCGECGVAFAMADSFMNRRIEDKKTWYCPNGHARVFKGESEVDQLKKQLQHKQQTLNQYIQSNASLHTQLTRQKNSNRALKAAKTKIMNRVKNGVCPCCNRSFKNLQLHFKSVHPELVKEIEVNAIHHKINSK
jgi:hypothetical protein